MIIYRAGRPSAGDDIDHALDASPAPFAALPTLHQLAPTSQVPGNASGLAPGSVAQLQTGFANLVGERPADPIPVANAPGNP
jgi:hypothetical protein